MLTLGDTSMRKTSHCHPEAQSLMVNIDKQYKLFYNNVIRVLFRIRVSQPQEC